MPKDTPHRRVGEKAGARLSTGARAVGGRPPNAGRFIAGDARIPPRTWPNAGTIARTASSAIELACRTKLIILPFRSGGTRPKCQIFVLEVLNLHLDADYSMLDGTAWLRPLAHGGFSLSCRRSAAPLLPLTVSANTGRSDLIVRNIGGNVVIHDNYGYNNSTFELREFNVPVEPMPERLTQAALVDEQ